MKKSLSRPSDTFEVPEGIYTRDDLDYLPDIEWAIKDFLEVNSIAWVYGLKGVCKSYFLLQLAASLATGEAFFGRPVLKSGRVVYVVAEAANSLKPRLKAWEEVHGQATSGKLFIQIGMDLTDESKVAKFIKDMKRLKPTAIIFSPLYKMAIGVDELVLGQQGRIAETLDDIREETGALVVIENHTNADGKRMSGHNVLERIGWTEMMLTKMPGNKKVSVKCTKQRNAEEFETFELLKMQLDDNRMILALPEEASSSPEVSKAKASDRHKQALLSELQTSPGTTMDLIGRAEVPRASAYRALDELKAEGLVRKVGDTWRLPGVLKRHAARPMTLKGKGLKRTN